MLAAMTSLTMLADAHTAVQPFNADFFVAAITVIPVLYLALTLQGPTTARMLKASVAMDDKAPEIVTFSVFAVPALVYILGGAGEFVGIVALYNRRDYGWGFVTLWALVVLTVVAVVVPAITAFREARDSARPENAGEAPPQPTQASDKAAKRYHSHRAEWRTGSARRAR